MKKDLYIPLVIIALTLVFGIICLMVYLSDGNAYWIKKKLKIGALLLTFNAIVYGTNAQDPFTSCYLAPEEVKDLAFIGPVLNANFTTIKNNQLQSDIKCNLEKLPDMTANGFGIGISWENHLGNLEETNSSIIINLIYDNYSANHTEVFESDCVQSDSVLLLVGSKLDLEYDYSFLTLDILYKHNFFTNYPLGLVGGFYGSYNIISDSKEILTPRVFDSGNIVYDDKRTLHDGENKTHLDFDFGIRLSIQYELFVSKRYYIIPTIGLTLPYTKVINDNDWNVNSWFAGISIRFGL
ncbi:MAG: hypothetical protein V1779_15700 [bacterium]